MPDTATLPAPAPTTCPPVVEDVHLYCCDPELGICGTPLDEIVSGADVTCVVCLDLRGRPCRPGCPLEVLWQ